MSPFPRIVELTRSNGIGGSTQEGSTTPQPPINLPPDLFTKPIQPLSSQLPNGHPRKPALSLEIEDQDSSSSSSDEQTADPFNPDSSVSDNEDDEHHTERLRSFASPTDHSRDTFGSAPHPAPSEDGSTATSPLKSLSAQVSTTEVERTNISQITTPAVAPSAGYKSLESEGNTNSSSRADRDKKPPPPPRSHHGKRINASGSRSTSRPESSRSTNRLSFHASSPESVTSVQPPGASNDNAAASSSPTLPPAPRSTSDYFLTASDSQQTTGSTDSLQRSHSQSKRPPTPPLSRRHSQMRRSKSTQSKSSNSRLTMSSLDSESNDSSQPPSPGPSTRSVASSMSQDRKRVSMPPPASGEIRAATAVSAAALPATGAPADSLSPPPSSQPTLSQPNRRASSYGSPGTGASSGGPPPPPPPRRARDSNPRNSDGGADAQANRTEAPLPQPSNANDILADLSRLQKEVDDLRGHYENRKVSQ